MRFNILLRFLILLSVLLYLGCATFVSNKFIADSKRPPEYVRFFELLDREVGASGVQDASSFKISGFPYLRTNRFLTELKDDLSVNFSLLDHLLYTRSN